MVVVDYPSKKEQLDALSVLSRARLIDDFSYDCVLNNIKEQSEENEL